MGEDDTALRERVTRLEEQAASLNERLTALKTELNMNTKLYDKQDHETRIQNVERDISNNNQVVGAVKWVAMSIGGSGVLVGLTALMEVV